MKKGQLKDEILNFYDRHTPIEYRQTLRRGEPNEIFFQDFASLPKMIEYTTENDREPILQNVDGYMNSFS